MNKTFKKVIILAILFSFFAMAFFIVMAKVIKKNQYAKLISDDSIIHWNIEADYQEDMSLPDFVVYLDHSIYASDYEDDEMINPEMAYFDVTGDSIDDLIIRIDNCGGNTLIICRVNGELYGTVFSVRQCVTIYESGVYFVSGGGWNGYSKLVFEDKGLRSKIVAKEDSNLSHHFYLEDIPVDEAVYRKWVTDNTREEISYSDR